MILFNNISVWVHNTRLLNEITFRVAEGEKVVLCGKSGSGKSTILKTLVGGHIPKTGSVYINGMTLSPQTLIPIRASVSFIGQEPILGAEHVEDALLLPFSYKAHRGERPDEEFIFSLLRAFHLSETIIKRKTNTLSGGEKQRLALVRAFLLKKKIFCVDEISSALDPESKAVVFERLLQPEYTILSVSHDEAWIQQCDKTIIISAGKIQQKAKDNGND